MGMKTFWLSAFLTAALGIAQADQYKELGHFSDGKGDLSVRLEIRADGDRRGLLRFDSGGYGGILLFDKKQWADVVSKCGQAEGASRKLPGGGHRTLGEISCRSGGSLRVEAHKALRKPSLRFTRLDEPGGKYPAVPFELQSSDFAAFQEALKKVSGQL